MVNLGSSAKRGIVPEQLPPAKDAQKINRASPLNRKKPKKSERPDAE